MRILMSLALLLAAGCAASAPETAGMKAEIWADNWFEMYVNGETVLEDSVPITTERSFNAETADIKNAPPMTIAFMVKDFKENETGLEYIGTDRQQMGDGGLIAQFRDTATGKVIAATNNETRCLVVQRAPTDRACVQESNPVAGKSPCGFVATPIPANWTAVDYDDSSWPAAGRAQRSRS